ncbi:MAG: NAD(P)H-hydrate dehydratase [Oligoflexales bacterium]|nr:NAD(P)H-hydrate dehydratase [Oligoflexales bacterium]
MKILSSPEMRRVESLSEKAQGANAAEIYMENAGRGLARCVYNFFVSRLQKTVGDILLLCGKGNNAGDAYVCGRFLLDRGFAVKALQWGTLASCSELCQLNYHRFLQSGGRVVSWDPTKKSDLLEQSTVVVDGLFGTGFSGVMKDEYRDLVRFINRAGVSVLSIDIPSGIDGTLGLLGEDAIVAEETLVLGLPKLGLFLNQAWNFVGHLQFVNFGLEESFINEANAEAYLITPQQAQSLIPKVSRDRHKYEAGSVTVWAGSPGMAGAAILSSHAALRAGAGIVRILHPRSIQSDLVIAPVELIKISYELGDETLLDKTVAEQKNERALDKIVKKLSSTKACLLGPGLGTDPALMQIFLQVIPQLKGPFVMDADALNLYATSLHAKGQGEKILTPKSSEGNMGCVMTPHLGEMHRLLGLKTKSKVSRSFLDLCLDFAREHDAVLILKGSPSFVLAPSGRIHVLSRGHPGMATAGTGDVLAGMVAAFLSQGLAREEAAVLAAYLHARAGELAIEERSFYGMMASDLLSKIPNAFCFSQFSKTCDLFLERMGE